MAARPGNQKQWTSIILPPTPMASLDEDERRGSSEGFEDDQYLPGVNTEPVFDQ
jgi:hypothetical protein